MNWRIVRISLAVAVVCPAAFVFAAAETRDAAPHAPYEYIGDMKVGNELDAFVADALAKRGLQAAPLCSDEVFLRRVYLDTIGTLPEVSEVRAFLLDPAEDRRAKAIDALLEREEFATYWAMKWCDLLRVKAEFPINLWPNAVQAYYGWIHEVLRNNMPYDEFAKELLTSSGSNFREAPVNFYRAIQGRDPATTAQAVALTFMGMRTATWPKDRLDGMLPFFSRIQFKKTGEWKEDILYLGPAPDGPVEGVFPDGVRVTLPPDKDPRMLFAAWLTAPENPYFARALANRAWSWFFGRGIVQEPDDFRDDNPPVIPELLEGLAKEFVHSGYDMRALFRLILNSRTYQQSSIPRAPLPDAETYFACYPARPLDAEVLADALCKLTGSYEEYTSLIPEPYSFIPKQERSIALEDGSITSPFLELFGRPPRDTGLESERLRQPSKEQRLHLLNSTHIQTKIERSAKIKQLTALGQKDPKAALDALYLAVLSRYPTDAEQAESLAYCSNGNIKATDAVHDLVWALFNSKEFLFRH